MTEYKDVVIVAEEEFYTKSDVCVYNILWEIDDKIYPMTTKNHVTSARCKNIVPPMKTSHAEVLFIWKNSIVHKERKGFRMRDSTSNNTFYAPASVIIRILEKKDVFLKQLEERWTADVNFVVNGEKCAADRQYLACISPVFKKMLYGKFAEAKENEIQFEGCESANVFEDFLLAISLFRIQPNPHNVIALLQMAHQYDIPFLIRNCEEHLKHCYEIAIVDRLILAAKFDLNSLKVHLGQNLSTEQLKIIWNDHAEKLCEAGVDYLTGTLINRL